MNRDVEGQVGLPFEVRIETGKMAELTRCIGATHEDHTLLERPVMPPTFLTTMAFWEAAVVGSNPWPLLAMDVGRALHAEQSYEFFGEPPRAGDRLIATSRIESITEKPSRRGTLTFAVMVTDFVDAETGHLVARARLTGVETPA